MAEAAWVRGILVAFIVALVVGGAVLVCVAPESAPEAEVSGPPTAISTPITPPHLRTPVPLPTPTAPFVPWNLLRKPDGQIFAAVAQGQGLNDSVLVVTLASPGQTAAHAIVWRDDGRLRSQLIPVTAEPGAAGGRRFATPSSAVIHAVHQTRDGQRELGIVYDATAYGSGSPTARFVLLRLEDEEWRVVWDAGDVPDWRGSHGRVEFPQDDLSELVVRSDSWSEGGDALSGVTHESNPGPHRYFVDTWVREGDRYIRTSAETVPSPYATLVEFLYALGTNDEARAQRQVTDAALVERARSFGLDGALGQHWLITCANGIECGKTESIRFDPQQTQGEPQAVVFFEEQDGRWLISDIQPDEGP